MSIRTLQNYKQNPQIKEINITREDKITSFSFSNVYHA
jgi:hypothetical protein